MHRIIPLSVMDYEIQLKQAIRAVDIITKEYEVFGFDDFKPQMKTETEYGVGLGKYAFWKRKKTK